VYYGIHLLIILIGWLNTLPLGDTLLTLSYIIFLVTLLAC
jgi:predicted acyltransferase